MDETMQEGAPEAQRGPWRWSPAGPPHAPYPTDKPRTDWERVVRNWLIVLALVVLSISLLTALVAANQAITIWLRPQFAPFVRVGGALVVAAVAMWSVLRLTRRSG